jgi:hypothetical protein
MQRAVAIEACDRWQNNSIAQVLPAILCLQIAVGILASSTDWTDRDNLPVLWNTGRCFVRASKE